MEIVRNSTGTCSIEGKQVIVKNHKGKIICECSIDDFLSFVPLINAVYDFKNGTRDKAGTVKVKEGP